MATAYRRHSNSGSNWNQNSTFSPRETTPSLRAPSPSFNHRSMQSSLWPLKASASCSPSLSISRATSQKSLLYQSTSNSVASPHSIPPVPEDLYDQEQARPKEGSKEKTSTKDDTLEKGKNPAIVRNRPIFNATRQAVASSYSIPPVSEEPCSQQQTSSEDGSKDKSSSKEETSGKGKEPAIVRTRPIFHANLEEAKKYHQNRLKSLSLSKKTPVSCEEIISRYCDHFNFQLPILEVIRCKESTRKRVFLRIKRRLVGIGEGQTTFEAMLAAYDDTVLYLFNGDSQLKKQLLQPNESIEWNHQKVGKK
ncbi:hypothetical protein, variant [Puccinia triticina 1-1 BBBD Race 1]|uniref:Uncharacterized protein n=2 Tax=Puccinia triticina TaxID=208348 RepID=A0A0C4F3I9_PUCT1|nr:uncharacterized protein PtA15_2A805 [Puccinia triticina]OAV92687.1 hypothetical protein PTTG_07669 [Puccinia triticina 1-1 BBBD Race 1]OAV92688.1 hypothetical protein, variant [Puccinia triticina 1-1 BBBD Race 1]WAQ82488.1 hypothetical protein PtA15_2A805 [Puccinia triticina]WAR53341.1 hypothetical protein PtB15_2B772 [Puccinia triticina]